MNNDLWGVLPMGEEGWVGADERDFIANFGKVNGAGPLSCADAYEAWETGNRTAFTDDAYAIMALTYCSED